MGNRVVILASDRSESCSGLPRTLGSEVPALRRRSLSFRSDGLEAAPPHSSRCLVLDTHWREDTMAR